MKTMLAMMLALGCTGNLVLAQSSTTQVSPRVTAKEGFTKSGAKVVLTRDGATVEVNTEVVLGNGLRVKPDGSVVLPGGEKATLRNNQLLTFQGKFEDVALRPNGVAPVSSVITPSVEKGTGR